MLNYVMDASKSKLASMAAAEEALDVYFVKDTKLLFSSNHTKFHWGARTSSNVTALKQVCNMLVMTVVLDTTLSCQS